jgi:hypothetical protein
MRRLIIGIALLLFLLVVAAFLTLDFRVARSATTVEHRLATYRASDDLPASMQSGASIDLIVEGQSNFAQVLRQVLAQQLAASVIAGDVELLERAAQPTGQATLLLTVEQESILWSPLFGRSRLVALLFFSSDDDLAWVAEVPRVVYAGDGPMVRGDGTFELADTSGGLLSLPGYRRLLAEQLATRIVEALEAVY